MKKILIFLFVLPFFFGCDKDGFVNNNPYLPNYSFVKIIDLGLPSYSQLNFPSNGVKIDEIGIGIRGIIVFNNGSGYVAFDAACPNQPLSSCSTMELSGIKAICLCDDAEYNLFNGLAPEKEYPMKQYRVEVSGNILKVYN